MGFNRHYFICTQLLDPVDELLGCSEFRRFQIEANQDGIDLMLDEELSDRGQVVPRLVFFNNTVGKAYHPPLVCVSQLDLLGRASLRQHRVVMSEYCLLDHRIEELRLLVRLESGIADLWVPTFVFLYQEMSFKLVDDLMQGFWKVALLVRC